MPDGGLQAVGSSAEQDCSLEDRVIRLVNDCVNSSIGLPQEVIDNRELQEAANGLFVELLAKGDWHYAFKIKEQFNFPHEYIYSDEAQQAAKRCVINRLDSNMIEEADGIIDEFSLPQDFISGREFQQAAKEAFIQRGACTPLCYLIQIIDKFNLPQEVIEDNEVQGAAKRGMVKCLDDGGMTATDYAVEIKDELNLSPDFVQRTVKKKIVENLTQGFVDYAIEIKNKFSLLQEVIEDNEVQEAAKISTVRRLYDGAADKAVKIKDEFSLPQDFISSKKFQQAAKGGIIKSLTDGVVDTAVKIKDEFSLPWDLISSKEVQQAAKQGIITNLDNSYETCGIKTRNVGRAVKIKDDFNLPPDLVQQLVKEGTANVLRDGDTVDMDQIKDAFNLSPDFVQQAAKKGLIKSLTDGLVDNAVKIKDEFNLPPDFVQQAAKKGLIKSLAHEQVEDHAVDIKNKFSLPEDFVQRAAKKAVMKYTTRGNVGRAVHIRDSFSLPSDIFYNDELQQAAKKGLLRRLSENNFSCAGIIGREFHLPPEFISSDEVQQAAKKGLIKTLASGNLYEACIIQNQFSVSKETLSSKEVQQAGIEGIIKKQIRDGYSSYNCSDVAVEIKKKFHIREDAVKSYSASLPRAIQDIISVWGLDTTSKLIDFLDEDIDYITHMGKRADLPIALERRDSQAIPQLYISLVEAEELKKNKVCLGALAREKDYNALLDMLHVYSDGWADKQNVLVPFEKGADVFGCERMFKYINRKGLIRHDALYAFDNITELFRSSGLKPKQFYGNILHQVRMDDSSYEGVTAHHHLNMLARNIDKDFQNIISTAKQYKDIEHLQELVNILDAPADIFSSWKNLKKYSELNQIVKRKEILEHLQELKKNGREKLYHYIETLAFHPAGNVSMSKVIEFWREPWEFLSASDEHTPEEIHNNKKPSNYIDIPNLDLTVEELRDAVVEGTLDSLQVFSPLQIEYKVKGETYIAKINLKSDPDGVLAGNDTASCMPFGSGKNNVYTFNLNTALFTLQVKRQDGSLRTVAQSVLTKDKDIHALIPGVIKELEGSEKHLADVLPEEILNEDKAHLACDNVEVAPNFREGTVIEMIYRDFFREYMEKFAEKQGLYPHMVIIGKGHSDALTHLPEMSNTFAPLAPVGYSDKTHDRVFVLDLTKECSGLEKIAGVNNPELSRQEAPLQGINGLDYLTFKDTLAVSYLEGKVYADNKSLIVNLHNIENGLMAKDISNAHKNRPNMSIKYKGKDGKVRAYLIAYEGKMDEGGHEDEPVIYIEDIASEDRISGGRLIHGFIQLYKQNYLDKGNHIPIYAKARETSSYNIIKKQLSSISRGLGVEFELEELPAYNEGKDIMTPVFIRPKRV